MTITDSDQKQGRTQDQMQDINQNGQNVENAHNIQNKPAESEENSEPPKPPKPQEVSNEKELRKKVLKLLKLVFDNAVACKIQNIIEHAIQNNITSMDEIRGNIVDMIGSAKLYQKISKEASSPEEFKSLLIESEMWVDFRKGYYDLYASLKQVCNSDSDSNLNSSANEYDQLFHEFVESNALIIELYDVVNLLFEQIKEKLK